MMLAIKESVTDMSPYVRKTAAHAIPKLYKYAPFDWVFGCLLPMLLISEWVSDLYSNKVSEENQAALGMGARGQGRLTESSGSLNDV